MFDVYYCGLPIRQRLTLYNFESIDEATKEIPGIIQHTEKAIGYAVEDPENYVVLRND